MNYRIPSSRWESCSRSWCATSKEAKKLPSIPTAKPTPHLVTYCVVAGERRVRAARLAGLKEVPALVCTYEETEALRVALLENIQREDLGPVEEANAYRNLLDSYGATQEELAEMLGKNRSSVTNMLRILTLEKEILTLLEEGRISRGHAKALLGLPAGPARVQLAKLCHSRGLSVRDCERRVRAGGGKPIKKKTRNKAAAGSTDPALRALMENAERVFGSPVTIARDPQQRQGHRQSSFLFRFRPGAVVENHGRGHGHLMMIWRINR